MAVAAAQRGPQALAWAGAVAQLQMALAAVVAPRIHPLAWEVVEVGSNPRTRRRRRAAVVVARSTVVAAAQTRSGVAAACPTAAVAARCWVAAVGVPRSVVLEGRQ
jgi:hypothetical protein